MENIVGEVSFHMIHIQRMHWINGKIDCMRFVQDAMHALHVV